MRVIIAGGRNFTSRAALDAAIAACGFTITEVVSGGARGADALGEAWAHDHGIPLRRFAADWKRYGKGAGMVRNAEMSKHADALIALPGGPGTADMIRRARKLGLALYIAEAA